MALSPATRPLGMFWALMLATCYAACAPVRAVNEPDAAGAQVDTIAFETREGTRLAFDVSPDGSSIVIDLLGQLWRIPSEGGNATPITNAVRDTAEDFDPAISPDGKQIVFEGDRPGGRALWLMPASGGTPKRLTSRFIQFFVYAAPSWAPDGRRIAYAIGDTLAVLDTESGAESVLRIDSLPAAPPGGGGGFIARNGAPMWSADGARIAFVNTAVNPVRGDGIIWEVPATGGVARTITAMRGVAPAWSPNGSQLAFFARDSASRWQVWAQTGSGPPRRLTNQDGVVTLRVRWMPDGRSLVYSADGGLWRVSPDGGAPTAIPFRARVTFPRRNVRLRPVRFAAPGATRVAKGFTSIALSPDGRRIAMIALDSLWIGDVGVAPRSLGRASGAGDNALTWSPTGEEVAWTRRDGPGRPFDLVVSHTGTGAQRAVASIGQDVAAPVWSPDGKWIAFRADGRLRVIDPQSPRVTTSEQTRDLGAASGFWGTLAWSPGSDALVLTELGFNARLLPARWIPLAGAAHTLRRFPPAPSNLELSADGHAIWVENNQLWRAPFSDSVGLTGKPEPLSDEPAMEARHARNGSILYLSVDGLRLRAADGSVRRLPWPLRYRVPAAPEPIMIRGARLLDGRGTPLSAPSDVLLQAGRIARIAPAGTLAAAGRHVVEARDDYLLPGFIDLHSHLSGDLDLLAYLHNGVTTVRDIASQRLKTPDTRNTIEAGSIAGPRIVYGGAMFHGGGLGLSTLANQMNSDAASTARAVAIIAGLDPGHIKERAFSNWWRAVHLVSEAHRFGIPVSGHCEHILPVVAAGVDGAEHVLDCFAVSYPIRADYVELARAAHLWIVPTAALRFSFLRAMDDPALVAAPDVAPFLEPAMRSQYGSDSVARRNAPALTTTLRRLERGVGRYHAAGVTLATGTDSPFPLGVQHEMEVLVESGLTPMEAIVAATGRAAKVLNAPEIGTIAEGQWADLVLLGANPLADIRNTRQIRSVIQGGRIVDREALRRRALP